MPSPPNHERRITALETRVREVETSHGETIYRMNRELTGVGITLRRMAEHFNIPYATAEEVDESLDQE